MKTFLFLFSFSICNISTADTFRSGEAIRLGIYENEISAVYLLRKDGQKTTFTYKTGNFTKTFPLQSGVYEQIKKAVLAHQRMPASKCGRNRIDAYLTGKTQWRKTICSFDQNKITLNLRQEMRALEMAATPRTKRTKR